MKNKKSKIQKLGWVVLVGIILVNIAAYNHAYRFTHFIEEKGEKVTADGLSLWKKLEVVFLGIKNPKPRNTSVPTKPYKTVKIQSHQLLEGWLIEKENHKGIVILFHGYRGNKSASIKYSDEFHKLGYTTLLVDFMGSGDSSGNQTTIGAKESKDVKEAYEFVKNKYPKDEIILYGTSMGAVSILKSLNDYKIEPDKIVVACPFGSMKATVKKRFDVMGVPSYGLAELLLFYGGLQNGFNGFEHNPTRYAENIATPTLLLYGMQDQRVDLNEVESIYQNLKGEKTFIKFKNSGHGGYLRDSKVAWSNAVVDFLK